MVRMVRMVQMVRSLADRTFQLRFLQNIQTHARVGAVLSWAIPGQGGLHHVNEQPRSYIIHRMKEARSAKLSKISKLIAKF